jgi:hypothetical protein
VQNTRCKVLSRYKAIYLLYKREKICGNTNQEERMLEREREREKLKKYQNTNSY